MIKAVLLDIDDTILDFHGYVEDALYVGFEKFGLGEFNDEKYRIFKEINNGIWRELERGEITYEQLLKVRFNRIFAALGVDFDGCVFEKYFKDRLFDSAIVIPGAYDILEYLSGKYTLCAASNGPVAQQMNRLRLADMTKYFKHIFISEEIGAQKPSGAFFEHCFGKINEAQRVEKNEIIMIGDSLSSDMKGAVDFGIVSCFYDRAKSGNTKGLAPHYTVTELCEIKNIL